MLLLLLLRRFLVALLFVIITTTIVLTIINNNNSERNVGVVVFVVNAAFFGIPTTPRTNKRVSSLSSLSCCRPTTSIKKTRNILRLLVRPKTTTTTLTIRTATTTGSSSSSSSTTTKAPPPPPPQKEEEEDSTEEERRRMQQQKPQQPISDNMRKKLLERSNMINPSLLECGVSCCWSNRAGLIITPIHIIEPIGSVYSIDRPFIWNTIDVGGRCTVIELPPSTNNSKNKNKKENNNNIKNKNDDDGNKIVPDLWIHSPVGLDQPLIDALNKIGNVRYVVSPNYEHVKYVSEWDKQSYPNAYIWACPGLIEKMPYVQWAGEIPYNYRPIGYNNNNNNNNDLNMNKNKQDEQQEEKQTSDTNDMMMWDTSIIQPLHINCEVNPITNKPFFNEVIFYHTTSRSLITTDLYWNYPSSDGIPNSQHCRHNDTWELAPMLKENNGRIPWKTQLWKFIMDVLYAPIYNNIMITNQNEYRNIIHHIINVWKPNIIIPCHGDIMRNDNIDIDIDDDEKFIKSALMKFFKLT